MTARAPDGAEPFFDTIPAADGPGSFSNELPPPDPRLAILRDLAAATTVLPRVHVTLHVEAGWVGLLLAAETWLDSLATLLDEAERRGATVRAIGALAVAVGHWVYDAPGWGIDGQGQLRKREPRKITVTAANRMLDEAFQNALQPRQTLEIRTGPPPINADALDTGEVIARLRELIAPTSGGSTRWEGEADIAGTAGHFRLRDVNGANLVQGTIGLPGDGADMTLREIHIHTGQTIEVDLTLSLG